jgi:Family of unknown function (DUF5946)
VVPGTDGPVHAYMPAVPGCWELFCSLADWKARLAGPGMITAAQDLMDAYAAQHPNSSDRRNRQSVAVHLMSLCLGLERGASGAQRRSLIGTWTHREYPVPVPPPDSYEVTARDIAAAAEPGRIALISQMAALTWSSWAVHHPAIRAWLAQVTRRSSR